MHFAHLQAKTDTITLGNFYCHGAFDGGLDIIQDRYNQNVAGWEHWRGTYKVLKWKIYFSAK